MSLAATELLDRSSAPSAPAPVETPHRIRERLRDLVRARGTDPYSVEGITGDCPAQTDQQIRDLEGWLARS